MGSLRFPGFYADYYSDNDYWKLNHALGGSFRAPSHPQSVLGWVGAFDRDTYAHRMSDSAKGRISTTGDTNIQLAILKIPGEYDL